MTKKLKPTEKSILKALLENPYRISTSRVAKESGTSWNTADKYLESFRKIGWVGHKTKGQKKTKDLWFPLL